MPAYPPQPSHLNGSAQLAGAGMPLITTCNDVDAYQTELDTAIQSFNSDLAKAQAFASQDDFAVRWFQFLGSWASFSQGECHWYSFDDSEGGMGYRIGRLEQFHDGLTAFEQEAAQSKGIHPSAPLPEAPEGPTIPGIPSGQSASSVITTVAVAAAVIVGVWGTVSIVRLFKTPEPREVIY